MAKRNKVKKSESQTPEVTPQGSAPIEQQASPSRKGRRIFGSLLMVLGIFMVAGAILLYTLNQQEALEAGSASAQAMPQMQQLIRENVRQQTEPTQEHVNPFDQQAVEQSYEMTEQVINGFTYIGYLKIPAISLELPVQTDWSQRKLQISPCRHMGSTKSDDLVIAAHNYPTHFGPLKDLHQGDAVEFVDMDGELSTYQVVTVNVIAPTALEEVTAEELDLVLYTCTYGGANRVMVGCQRTES